MKIAKYSIDTPKTTKTNAMEVFRELSAHIAAGGELNWYISNATVNPSVVFVGTGLTGKLTGIPHISTNRQCNKQCELFARDPEKICFHCYVENIMKARAATRDHGTENAAVLTSKILSADEIPLFITKYCRFEYSGDLINVTQAINYLNIARFNPGTTFGFWTKNPAILDKAIREVGKPSNVVLIVSSPFVNRIAAYEYDWIDHVFTVWDSVEAAAAAGQKINCRAMVDGKQIDRCTLCRRCYTVGNDEFYINELLKK